MDVWHIQNHKIRLQVNYFVWYPCWRIQIQLYLQDLPRSQPRSTICIHIPLFSHFPTWRFYRDSHMMTNIESSTYTCRHCLSIFQVLNVFYICLSRLSGYDGAGISHFRSLVRLTCSKLADKRTPALISFLPHNPRHTSYPTRKNSQFFIKYREP